jgi:hypothetical protein
MLEPNDKILCRFFAIYSRFFGAGRRERTRLSGHFKADAAKASQTTKSPIKASFELFLSARHQEVSSKITSFVLFLQHQKAQQV